ncbi:MAG: FkbM family methyltransferase [Candidatus Aminicenantes bacterium]|nr:MAG: FkbM family methyltransferase [Candidatus Aminicenantes bacterium]
MKQMIKTIKKNFCRLRGYATLRLRDRSLIPGFHVSTNIEAEKILEKDNEEELLETFLGEIRPGDTVFDIGANIGLYTLPSALKLRGSGAVYAFEPVPLWFQRLRENIQLNKLSSREHVFAYNLGLSDKDEICDLVMKGVQGSGMGSITANYREQMDTDKMAAISVQLVRGDDFLLKEGIPRPNIVKIDVEGAELAVVQGLEKSLQSSACRFILCEVHPHFMPHPPDHVEKLLEQYGFDIRISEQRRTEYYLLARRMSGNSN